MVAAAPSELRGNKQHGLRFRMSLRRHLQIVTSDGQPVEDTCFHRTHGLRRTDELGLDLAEELFLRLFRGLCVGLFCENDDGVSKVHDFIVGELGDEPGTLLLSNTVDLIYAIRATRRSDFSFMPAECPICSRHISNEECATLMLVRAARAGDNVALMEQASVLTEGHIMIGVGLAAKVLGEQLDDLSAAGQIPGLRAASRSNDAGPFTCS